MTDTLSPTHRQFTDPGQDYVMFTIHCGTCGQVMLEFVHKQVPIDRDLPRGANRSSYEPNREVDTGSGFASAQSWYKPLVRVACVGTAGQHIVTPVKDGEDRNQVCRSRPLTHAEFVAWQKTVEAL